MEVRSVEAIVKALNDAGVEYLIVCYQTLRAMKRQAGRPKDMLDIEALGKLDPYR